MVSSHRTAQQAFRTRRPSTTDDAGSPFPLQDPTHGQEQSILHAVDAATEMAVPTPATAATAATAAKAIAASTTAKAAAAAIVVVVVKYICAVAALAEQGRLGSKTPRALRTRLGLVAIEQAGEKARRRPGALANRFLLAAIEGVLGPVG